MIVTVCNVGIIHLGLEFSVGSSGLGDEDHLNTAIVLGYRACLVFLLACLSHVLLPGVLGLRPRRLTVLVHPIHRRGVWDLCCRRVPLRHT